MANNKHQPAYLVVNKNCSGDNESIAAYLAEMAESGWELVTVVGDVTYYFKAIR